MEKILAFIVFLLSLVTFFKPYLAGNFFKSLGGDYKPSDYSDIRKFLGIFSFVVFLFIFLNIAFRSNSIELIDYSVFPALYIGVELLEITRKGIKYNTIELNNRIIKGKKAKIYAYFSFFLTILIVSVSSYNWFK
jgi:hypothetical protein